MMHRASYTLGVRDKYDNIPCFDETMDEASCDK